MSSSSLIVLFQSFECFLKRQEILVAFRDVDDLYFYFILMFEALKVDGERVFRFLLHGGEG